MPINTGTLDSAQVVDLVDPNENPWVPEVAAALGSQPLERPGTRWRTLVGVKLFLH